MSRLAALLPQVLTQQAMVGTVIALIGTWLYTEMSSRHKHKKPEGGAEPKAA
jgi:diaminopimelate decarboxylase/solute carrier family 35 protein E1